MKGCIVMRSRLDCCSLSSEVRLVRRSTIIFSLSIITGAWWYYPLVPLFLDAMHGLGLASQKLRARNGSAHTPFGGKCFLNGKTLQKKYHEWRHLADKSVMVGAGSAALSRGGFTIAYRLDVHCLYVIGGTQQIQESQPLNLYRKLAKKKKTASYVSIPWSIGCE